MTNKDISTLTEATSIALTDFLVGALGGNSRKFKPQTLIDLLAKSFDILALKEVAMANADVAGLGQLWVKNTTPNELWFTDDAGTDYQIASLAGTEVFTNKTITTIKSPKGADIVSANPLVIGTDGTYFDVTGTTGFSAMTVAAGSLFVLQFDGALTITHGASIDLPGETNLTTAAGDRLICFAEAANVVQVLSIATASASGAGISNVVEDTTPQLGGDLDCNGQQIQWSKGADVAAATALPLLTDGNYFDVTGGGTITSFNTTGGPGTVIKLRFVGALTLIHHATNLILNAGGGNITTAPDDQATFVEYAAGQYRLTSYLRASGNPVVLQSATTTSEGGVERATTTEVRDPSIDGKYPTVKDLYDGAVEVSLIDAPSIVWDMSTGIDFTVTLGGDRTLANATSKTVGKRGRIRVVQDATGNRTLAYGTDYEFANGVLPVLTTTANAEDYLDYDVVSATSVRLSFSGDWS